MASTPFAPWTILENMGLGFALAVPIEAIVFAWGLRCVPVFRRVLFALTVNAFSHPVLVLILFPTLYGLLPIAGSTTLIEVLVVALESALVALMTDGRFRTRDVVVVALANAASFGAGWLIFGLPAS